MATCSRSSTIAATWAASLGNSEGLYYLDTRMLSQFQLLLEEARPLLLSSMTQDDNAVFTADLSNPDLLVDGKIALRRENVHLNRMRFVWDGACYERLLVRNFSDRHLQLRLTYRFASDFADLFEVRGEHRRARGEQHAALESDHGVVLDYMGLDKLKRSTHFAFAPSPKTLTTTRAAYELSLKPRATRRIFVRCSVAHGAGGDWDGRVFYRRMRAARQALHESSERAASIEGSNSVFNEIVRRSVSDLYMLVTDTPQGPYPYAGIPWFSTPFGRDAIITALMTLWLDPMIAKGVLKFLAFTQATAVEPERDAEPGKILHEMRHGEMANLREVPFGRYYGSIDATPLFVLLLGEYFRRTGDLETVRSLWPNAQAALDWIDRYGDRDGDGFVEYHRQTQEGLGQSGLEGFVRCDFPSGRAAWRKARSHCAKCRPMSTAPSAMRPLSPRRSAHPERAATLAAQAEKLRQDFESRFWCEELSVYALALDGAKEPCRVVSSNAGQVLFTGIASAERAQRVARTLLSASMFSGWGIRTRCLIGGTLQPDVLSQRLGLAARQRVDRDGLCPLRPKAGSVADILRALRCRRPTWTCGACPSCTAASCGSRAMRRPSIRWPARRRPGRAPRRCALLQASLGLELLDRTGEIKFYRPTLPDFLDHVHLRNLRLSSGSADVLLAPPRRAHCRHRHPPRGGRGGRGALLSRITVAGARGGSPASRTAASRRPRRRSLRESKTHCACRSDRPPSPPRRCSACCRCRWRIRPRRATD